MRPPEGCKVLAEERDEEVREIIDDARRFHMPQEADALLCCRQQRNDIGRRNLVLDLFDFAKQLHQRAQPWIAGEAHDAIVRLEIENELRGHDMRVPRAAYTTVELGAPAEICHRAGTFVFEQCAVACSKTIVLAISGHAVQIGLPVTFPYFYCLRLGGALRAGFL